MEEIKWANTIFASLAIIFLLTKILSITKKSSKKNIPPSPPKLPILGHLHLIKEPAHRSFQNLSKAYGPFLYLWFCSRPVVVIQSPSLVEECFTKNDLVLANRPRRMAGKYLHYNYTTLGAANYGSYWRDLRKFTVVEILSTARLNMFENIRKEEVSMLVKNLYLSSGQDFAKVEMKSRLSELSFNVIMRMIAGKRYFGREVENIDEAKKFREIISETFILSAASTPADYLPILKWFDYQNFEKRLASARKKMDVFLQNLIDQYKVKRDSCQGDKEGIKNMIETVLSLQDSDPEYYSDEFIQALIMQMLSAGTDTSAVTVEWAMSLLLNHPEVLAKARAELDEHVGHDRLVNEADLPKLQYLSNIIKETFRLFPSAPLLVPHASSDTCTIGGYTIPRGTIVIVNAWGLHRNPEVWDDPDEFRPERFQGFDSIETYKLIPFGVGRRSCPGAGLANKVVGLALAAMIQCFDWKRVGKEEIDMTEGIGLTMPKVKPLETMCRPRESMIDVFLNVN